MLVDAARRAACARSEPLATYLAALEPGATPDPAVAASLRDGIRASLAAAQGDEVIDPALGVVLDEGARALDPVKLVTLLRDGSDACQPLTWLPPSGPDQIGAQLALRTFVAAACDLKTPAAPLAAAIAATDPLPAVAKAAGVDEARAEQAIRAGLATAADGLEKDKVLSVDRRRRDQGAVPRGARRPAAAGRPGRRRRLRAAHLAAHERRARRWPPSWSCTASWARPASRGCRCSPSPRR